MSITVGLQETESCEFSIIVLPFQDYFSYSVLHFHMNLSFFTKKERKKKDKVKEKDSWNSGTDCLESVDKFGGIAILTSFDS
jgi:hypothetical protein